MTFLEWRWWNEHATQDKTNEEEPWAGPFLQSGRGGGALRYSMDEHRGVTTPHGGEEDCQCHPLGTSVRAGSPKANK